MPLREAETTVQQKVAPVYLLLKTLDIFKKKKKNPKSFTKIYVNLINETIRITSSKRIILV